MKALHPVTARALAKFSKPMPIRVALEHVETPAQLRAVAAKHLRASGVSLGRVATALGVSKTQVKRMTSLVVAIRGVAK